MRKFVVQVSQTKLYEIEVEASDAEVAVQTVLDAFDPEAAEFVQVDDQSGTVVNDLGPVWRQRDEESAYAEGWALIPDETRQRAIRALPCNRKFLTDQAAENYVKREAAGGSERHRRACDLVVYDRKCV